MRYLENFHLDSRKDINNLIKSYYEFKDASFYDKIESYNNVIISLVEECLVDLEDNEDIKISIENYINECIPLKRTRDDIMEVKIDYPYRLNDKIDGFIDKLSITIGEDNFDIGWTRYDNDNEYGNNKSYISQISRIKDIADSEVITLCIEFKGIA